MTPTAPRRGARGLLSAAAAIALALAPPPPTAGQAPGEPPAGSFGETFSVGYVLVPVVVRAGSGYARGLDVGDFRLEVEGRRVAIESFEPRADAPASLVFLQDLSGSMENSGKLAASQEAVRYFLDRAKDGD